ncbi:MAG: insulinase family protein [Candidatus Krumholzibacteriota bacterium]|nr:insulinase family protein [Candidatus Krumholzibacteriota bacterium]
MVHRRTLPTAALIALCAILAGAAAPAIAGSNKSPAIDLGVTVKTLDNGLKVILLEDHSVPVLSRQTFYHVGARNERPGITGISHFMEHMMFNGAERYGPKEFDAVLEANGGYSNAFTSKDMTAYYEDISSDGLELVVDLDSDRMAALALDSTFLCSEMGVVKEERRYSIDNSIFGLMYEELFALAYKAHPYSWPVLGWMSDLDGICRDDCVAYFRTYYAPNNAVLIVAGDFDTDEAFALVERYYGGIRRQEPPAPLRTAEPEQFGERRAEVRKPAALPQLLIGFAATAVSSPDIYAIDVLQTILTTGHSSRLYKRLVRESAIAVEADSWFSWMIDPSLYIFHLTLKADADPAECERIVYEELAAIASGGVTGAEMAKAKNSLEADFQRSMQTVNGKASKIGRYEMLFGDYRTIQEVPGKYRAVTADDVKRVAETYFSPNRRNVVTLVPERAES